jgi:hypothetical protein
MGRICSTEKKQPGMELRREALLYLVAAAVFARFLEDVTLSDGLSICTRKLCLNLLFCKLYR